MINLCDFKHKTEFLRLLQHKYLICSCYVSNLDGPQNSHTDHCIGCHTCAFTVARCFVIRGTTPYKSLSHQVRNYEGRGRPSLPFLENHKKCSSSGKKGPDFVDPEVKFTIQNIVLRVSRTKSSKIFCCGTFYP